MSSRKAYSCTPCRTKKIKCDRRKVCGQCRRKSIECIWPENGVPLEDEVESPAAPALSSPINTPYHPHTLPPPIRSGPSYHPLTSHIHTHTLPHPHSHAYGHGPSHIPSTTSISIATSATRTRTRSPPLPHQPPAAAPAPPVVDVPHTVVHAEQLDHSILNNPDSPGSPSGSRSPRASDRMGDSRTIINAALVGSRPNHLGDSDRNRDRSRANDKPVNRPSSSESLMRKEDGEVFRDYTLTQPRLRERDERDETPNHEYAGATRPRQDKGGGTRQGNRITPTPTPGTAPITKAVDGGSAIREADHAAAAPGGSATKSRRHRSFPFHPGGVDGDGMLIFESLIYSWNASNGYVLRSPLYLIHHPLHLPTFLAQYNQFWSMSPSHRRSTVHSRWLALLYIILCLGDHFGDEDMSTDVTLEGRLLVACEDCLAHADFLDEPSTETIQTIICLNLYLNNKNRVNAARSLLGTAIKMAISMGMSLGRRLWWSLVSQDAYTASNSGFTYLINLSHASTGLFANLDDDEIRPSGFHSPSKPLSETTTATYHILKIDFALVVRHFIDAVNVDFPNASYEAIMELDRQFRQVYDSLPAVFRPDLPQSFELSYAGSKRYLVEQRIFMGITLHNRIMRLHRAYMVRGYDDPKYEYSTRVCLESAYALPISRTSPVACRGLKVLRALLSRDSEVSQQAQSLPQAQPQPPQQNQTQDQGQNPRKRKHSHEGDDSDERSGGKSSVSKMREKWSVHAHGDTDRSEPSQLDLANTSLTDLERLLRQAFPFVNPSSSSIPSVSSFTPCITASATSASARASGSASAPGSGSHPGPGSGLGSVSDGGAVPNAGMGIGPTSAAATSDPAAEFWQSLFSMNSW
ncbi:hypothetical protein I305_02047 [Cryptococcus gattii E566]|uniref:Zn(2)-C6 fungal-type domain-containing protein n=1 Tax=Cryptococcus gattii serotype B (strain WM276 / ATCC MYA-4071) TaxID=367775 RepID=E6RD36_CRYGW|nr:uncharacterized protein CGB_K0220W [Cryptococcus gattii WM276]ADV24736.1 Conserved hypothetical protein [Cryptococcus gattii WM276]KIY35142.1 hypothetical protein I305_02047 [Cryptococcus gattii E566]KJE00093.1 hypothetical protein I311_06330 [Cryptococcus gattii NT-10]